MKTRSFLLFVLLACAGCARRLHPNEPEREPITWKTHVQDPQTIVPESYSWTRGAGLGAKKEDQVMASFPYGSIELERTICYGTCPSYVVTFFEDGQAVYNGRRFVPRIGRFVGRIGRLDYSRLCLLVDRTGFRKMEHRYALLGVTDQPTTILRVRPSDSFVPISVSDYGNAGPVELWALQEVVDAVAESIDWEEE